MVKATRTVKQLLNFLKSNVFDQKPTLEERWFPAGLSATDAAAANEDCTKQRSSDGNVTYLETEGLGGVS